MTLTPAARTVLRDLYPFPLEGVGQPDLDEILDRWFADDHYNDNPVYTWTDNESTAS